MVAPELAGDGVTFSNIQQNQGAGKFWWPVITQFYSLDSEWFPLRRHGRMAASATDFTPKILLQNLVEQDLQFLSWKHQTFFIMPR